MDLQPLLYGQLDFSILKSAARDQVPQAASLTMTTNQCGLGFFGLSLSVSA